MKRIILCADDYGQNDAISQAIIALITLDRLTAVSCMVTSPYWPKNSAMLSDVKLKIDVGLHFDFTEYRNNSLFSLLVKSQLRVLNNNELQRELGMQLDCFIESMGRLPDFIDGHQHVHQFPQIRDAIYELYDKRLREHGVYIRTIYSEVSDWGGAYIKQLVLRLSGAARFKEELDIRKIPHNASFSGVYGFRQSANYADKFEMFLASIRDGGLMMCHPGLLDGSTIDSIASSRYNEYLFLKSDDFLRLCEKHQISLTRFCDL